VAYHPVHDRNLSHFEQAMKDGLHYCSNAFGSFPFSQLSLVETSAFSPSSTSLPGVMAMSEPRGGWVADLRGNVQPDYVYYLTALQVARQWWGQQVSGNHTVGSSVIADAIPEYAALCMMERRYGKEAIAPLYGRWQNDYRWIRATNWNPNGEARLLFSDRTDLSRVKGAMALYGLAGLTGEDSVNAALAEFLRRWALKDGGPYPGANDLYAVLKSHTPDSLHYYLEDTWEKVVLYDNHIDEAEVLPRGKDGNWHVRVHVTVGKAQFDAKNEPHEVTEMNDLVDIGIFGEAKNNGTPPLLKMCTARYHSGSHTLEVALPEKPVFVLVDPYRKLLDVRPEDNRKILE